MLANSARVQATVESLFRGAFLRHQREQGYLQQQQQQQQKGYQRCVLQVCVRMCVHLGVCVFHILQSCVARNQIYYTKVSNDT
jgi:hypothetical protein